MSSIITNPMVPVENLLTATGGVNVNLGVNPYIAPNTQSLRDQFGNALTSERTNQFNQTKNIYAGRGVTGSGEEATAFGQISKNFADAALKNEEAITNKVESYNVNQQNWQRQRLQDALTTYADVDETQPVGSAKFDITRANTKRYLQAKLAGTPYVPLGVDGKPTGQQYDVTTGKPIAAKPTTPTTPTTPTPPATPSVPTANISTDQNTVAAGDTYQDPQGNFFAKLADGTFKPITAAEGQALHDEYVTNYATQQMKKSAIGSRQEIAGKTYEKQADGSVLDLSSPQGINKRAGTGINIAETYISDNKMFNKIKDALMKEYGAYGAGAATALGTATAVVTKIKEYITDVHDRYTADPNSITESDAAKLDKVGALAREIMSGKIDVGIYGKVLSTIGGA